MRKRAILSILLLNAILSFALPRNTQPLSPAIYQVNSIGTSIEFRHYDSTQTLIPCQSVASIIAQAEPSKVVSVWVVQQGDYEKIMQFDYSVCGFASKQDAVDSLIAWSTCDTTGSHVFISSDSAVITHYNVLNTLNTPPGSPATGDTYLVGTSPTGAWVGQNKDIAEWDGADWVFTDGVQGDFLYNATTALTYIFRSGNWVQTTGIPALNNGNNISSGLKIGTNNARSLKFETANVERGRIDSIGRFHVYNLPTASTGDTFVSLVNTLGKFTKQGKSSFLSGVSGGGTSTTLLYSVRYGQLDTLISTSALETGAVYKITDRSDNRGIFLHALSASEISKSGIRNMLCPAKYNTGTRGGNDWIGVWHGSKSVVSGDRAVWGGLVWENGTGAIGSAVDDFTLDGTNWTVIPKASYGDSEYVELQFDIIYDFENDWIQWQMDGFSNGVGVPLNVFGYQPVDCTDWNSLSGGGCAIYANHGAVLGIFNNDGTFPIEIANNTAKEIVGNKLSGSVGIYGNKSNVIKYNDNTGDIGYNATPIIQNLSSSVTDVTLNTVTAGSNASIGSIDGDEYPFSSWTGAIEGLQFNGLIDTTTVDYMLVAMDTLTNKSKLVAASSLGGAEPYLVYTALLTQSGTDAPTAIVLGNTLGFTPTWNYDTAGKYSTTQTFDKAKTTYTLSGGTQGELYDFAIYIDHDLFDDTNKIIVTTASADDYLYYTPIEIRVYP